MFEKPLDVCVRLLYVGMITYVKRLVLFMSYTIVKYPTLGTKPNTCYNKC
jgi:hypothetical protein